MKYPIRLATLCIAVAWVAAAVVAVLRHDYLFLLIAVASIGYALAVASYLHDQDRLRRRIHHSQTRTDKKEPHP